MKKVIKDNIGNTSILFQAIDDSLEVVGTSNSGRSTNVTGIEEELESIYVKLKSVIRSIAEDVGSDFAGFERASSPKQLELEFNLAVTAQTGLWVFTGTSEGVLNVKMIWELDTSKAP